MPRLSLPPHGHDRLGRPFRYGRRAGSCRAPWREYRLPVGQLHPQIHLAHRLVGNVAVQYREIVDHELIAVLDGHGDFHCGPQRYRYGPGSLLLIPPCTPHTLITRCGAQGDHMAVHFDWAAGLPGEQDGTDRGNYRVVIEGLPPLGPVTGLDDPAVGLLAEAVRQHQAESAISALRASVAMQGLVLHLADGKAGRTAYDDDAAVAAALSCIAGHYHEHLQVDDLAAAAGLQRSRFAQRFKAWSGRPPMAFLRRYRIDRAGELLLSDAEATLGEVAERCGFADAFSLSKAFKAELGMSPSTFRLQRA